ncbi:MAG: hypothetical protein OXC07_08485, partial [Kistimonas sp.]|nr:hypothetical protein [Kistimonas sp.]
FDSSVRFMVPRLDSIAGRLVSSRVSHKSTLAVEDCVLIVQVPGAHASRDNSSRQTGPLSRASRGNRTCGPCATEQSRPASCPRLFKTLCCLARRLPKRIR